MTALRIAVLVGSIRPDSYNRRLARAVEKLMPEHYRFNYVRIDDLPLYSQELDGRYPSAASRLKSDIESAQALLFVTPEYNRSVPGVLKNAIDIASRPWGKNSFVGKPGAVIGTSIGAPGSGLAQQHLRNILAYLDVPLLGQPEVFVHFKDDLISPTGDVNNDGTRRFLREFVDRYCGWIDRFCAHASEEEATSSA